MPAVALGIRRLSWRVWLGQPARCSRWIAAMAFSNTGDATRVLRDSTTSPFWKLTYRHIRSSRCMTSAFRASAPSFSRIRLRACATRTSLKPGGIMTMVVWRGIKDNPWLGHAKDIVLQFLPPPGENAQTCGPGPFSMADTGVVTKQLEIAGYRDIQFEQIDAQVFVGKDLDDAAAFQLAIGPAGEVYREAGKLAEQRYDEIANALKSQLAKYQRSNGLMMEIQFVEGNSQKSIIMSAGRIPCDTRLRRFPAWKWPRVLMEHAGTGPTSA